MDKVSIIVPCFNQENFLAECLESVLNQKYKNWECIIVNDGSTDKSEEIAIEYSVKDNRFNYLNIKNSGVSFARNYGINNSNGEFILPLDGDDKIDEDYIFEAIKAFNRNPSLKLVYCKANLFGDENIYWDLPKYKYEDFIFQNCIFCSAMFKRIDFINTEGYDLKMIYGYEDWEFWMQLLDKNDTVFRIDKILFFYRKTINSRNNFIKNEQNHAKMIDYIYKKHHSKYFNLLELNDSVSNFRKIYDDIRLLNKIKSSISYKTIYKVEKEIKSFIKKHL